MDSFSIRVKELLKTKGQRGIGTLVENFAMWRGCMGRWTLFLDAPSGSTAKNVRQSVISLGSASFKIRSSSAVSHARHSDTDSRHHDCCLRILTLFFRRVFRASFSLFMY